MNISITFFSIVFITLVGYIVIKLLSVFPRKNTLFILSLGYGLGTGLITTQMYLYARIGITWTILNLIGPWIILAFLYHKLWIPYTFKIAIKKKNIDIVVVLLLIGIGVCISYTVFEALIRPLSVWDGWAAWIIKSKAFFLDKTIAIETVSYIQSDGPLVISLLGAWVYMMLGTADDTAVLLTSSAFYVFLLLLFYSVLKERYTTRYALFFTFLLATTQTLIRQGGRLEAGQADLPLGYFIMSVTMLLLVYVKKNTLKIISLLLVFLSITTFIKLDAMAFVLVIIVLVIWEIYRNRTYSHLLILSFWIIPILDWQNYKKIAHIDGIYTQGHGIIFLWNKIEHAVSGSVKALIYIKSWNLLWVVYFYCLVFLFTPIKKEIVLIHIIVVSQLVVYLLLYCFTIGNAPESSAERLLTHLAPLALLSIAFIAKSK